MTTKVPGTDLIWLDISDELYRVYVYKDGSRYRVDGGIKLNVKKDPAGDKHRIIRDTNPGSIYVAAGWVAIEWQTKDASKPFTF